MISNKKIKEIRIMEGGTLVAFDGYLAVVNRRYFIFDDTGIMRVLDKLARLSYIKDGIYSAFIIIESDYERALSTDYSVEYEEIDDINKIFDLVKIVDVTADNLSRLIVRLSINEEEPVSGGILDETGTLPVRFVESMLGYDDKLVEICGGMLSTDTDSWYQILRINAL